MPDAQDWLRLLTLADYNTRVVLAGNALLGAAAGMVGMFALLRRRALVGDALCHAALPGIAAAFLLALAVGWEAKSMTVLLLGGAVSGGLGVIVMLTLRRFTILPDDAVMGIVLSSFFGAGVVLLTYVQQLEEGHAAGLETFLYGRAATLLARDAWLIGVVGFAAVAAIVVLFKELKMFCFDSRFAAAMGLGRTAMDVVIMLLVACVLLVGLQAVGLILMVALLVIPAAAARFWTNDLWRSVWMAGLSGGICGCVGAGISAVVTSVPTGAAIVLVGSLWFGCSMAFGAKRGVGLNALRDWRNRRHIERQHVLRACFELAESRGTNAIDAVLGGTTIAFEALRAKRNWPSRQLMRLLRRLEGEGLVVRWGQRDVRLTAAGLRAGAMLTHYHRLWELYLLRLGDVSLHRVDESADEIEHVTDADLTSRLESVVLGESKAVELASPHPLDVASDTIQNEDRQ